MPLNVTLQHQLSFFFRYSSTASCFSLQAHFKLLESFNSSKFSLFSASVAYLSASFLCFSIAISSWLFWAFKAAISFSISIAPTLFYSFASCPNQWMNEWNIFFPNKCTDYVLLHSYITLLIYIIFFNKRS